MVSLYHNETWIVSIAFPVLNVLNHYKIIIIVKCDWHFPAPSRNYMTPCYMVFPVQLKYHSIKTIKSTCLYYKMCWKHYPCSNTLYHLNMLKLHHEEELCELNSNMIILGGSMSKKMKPCFTVHVCVCAHVCLHEIEERQMMVNITIINWLQKPVAETNPNTWVTCLRSMNYNHIICLIFK